MKMEKIEMQIIRLKRKHEQGGFDANNESGEQLSMVRLLSMMRMMNMMRLLQTKVRRWDMGSK